MRSFMKRGFAALLALLLMLTSVPMTNVFAAEDDGSETAVEMSVEESAISTSFDQDIPMEESEEVIELPDETGESSEEEETDPARAGPEETEAEEDSATEESIQKTEVEEQTEGETTSETESESETAVESEVETVTEQETEPEAEAPVFTPDITFPNASYDAFASERTGLALTRTEQQIQFFNTFVDQAKLSVGASIDALFGADNENYSAEYLLSLNPNQFTETTPVYIGADGNYYVVSAIQALNGMEAADYQPATAFYNGISEAFIDIRYLGSGVYQIPAKRAEYCFSEHYYTDDAAGNIIGVTFGLRIQQLFGYNPAAGSERTISADVLYPDASNKVLPATVNLNDGTVTVKLCPEDSDIDLSSGYNLAAVINKGESTPSGIQLIDGGKTAVFSVGDARAVGCLDIAIAYQAPAATDVPMQAQTKALKMAAPKKALLRGAASGSYSMYDSNYAEVDPDQIPSNLAVGDMFYFNARLHVAGVYDNYDAAGNIHVGANSIPTHEAQSFTYYNELADWTVIKNWFVTKLNDASYPDPDTDAPGVMRQMTEANMLARAANNGSSVNLSGAKIFGYVSDPLGSNTTNGKTLNLSGISIAIGCMHAWAYMGSTAPADVVASVYQFTGTNSWAPQQAYGFFEPVVAMQCTEIRKSGNTTYTTFKVVTQMLEIGNIQNPANYQCGFATLRLAYEKEDTGYAKVVKSSGNTDITSGNACYSLTGAQYTVYSDANCTAIAKDVNGNKAILTVQDETGNTNTVELDAGTYYVKETKAGKGYFLDSQKYPVTVKSGETASVPVKDYPVTDPVDLKLTKRDASTGGSAQGATVLSGAEYTMKYYDNQTGIGTPKRTWVFKTDSHGVIRFNENYRIGGDALYEGSSGHAAIPIGTVTIQETKAPAGYILNNELCTVHFTQGADGLVHSDQGVWNTTNQADEITIASEEPVIAGGVKIEKWDKELQRKVAQGDADFNGIKFEIKNQNANAVKVNGTLYANGAVVYTLTTNAAGDAQTPANLLPYGTYTIQEVATNNSYLLTDGTAFTFTIRESGKIVDTNTAGNKIFFKDNVERGGVKVGKIDRETDTNEPQGWATLEGAEFTIYNNSEKSVIVEDTEYAVGEAVKVLVSEEDGTAESAADLLPYGTYYIKETKAPEGYLLNATWRVDFQIRNDGDIVDITKDPKIGQFEEKSGWFKITGGSETNPAEAPDDIKRADLKFAKYDIDGRKMAGIPFLISRLDKKGMIVESHVVVTDENGSLNTKNHSKTDDKVNSLDSYVRKGVFTDDSKLDSSVGVWFGEQSARDDSRGALIYANYRIQELSCKANEGQDLLVQDLFLLDQPEDLADVFENNRVYDLENVFIDLIIHPESDLIDKTSDSKSATLSEKAVLVDTIRYDHLKIYKDYKIETEIIHENREGNKLTSLGKDSITFRPAKVDETDTANGVVKSEVQIDTSNLNGGTLHAVDTFYVKVEDNWVKLLTHNRELNDERQKVFVPYMETTASDSKTNDHVGTIEKEAEIHDIVTYENLANDRMYKLVGTLRYADTGEIVKGTDGNDCVVESVLRVSYRAKEVTRRLYGYLGPKDGSVTMPAFKFDASAMAGRTLVVTENLYDYDTDELIISHEELTDEKQSVHYLKVETEAEDSKTGTRTATVGEKETIIDTVTLTNTIPGMTYVVTGDLVYQEDCTDSAGTEHKKGDVIVTHDPVSVTATSGVTVVELIYNVDSTLLEGISGVVFEDVWHKDVKVATHHDYEAKPQTPHWPKVRTSAVDGDTETKTGVVSDKATIVDTVSLTNLNIGDTYKVSGILMQQDGEVFRVNGKAVTAESEEFTAESTAATIEISFTFNFSEIAGKSLVVFEKLYFVEAADGTRPENPVEVARHEDLTDKNQMVDYPEGKTNANDGKTGDEVGTVGEKETIIDTVTYKNLHIGDTYTVHGDLHYKEDFTDRNGVKHAAGDVVKDESGKTVTSSVTFTAEKKNGSIDLKYEVNSELLRGASVVVFEDFVVNKVMVYSHADLEDEDQRIDYPEVKTSAADARTEDHVGSVGIMKLIDTVELTNLTIGKEYRVTGILMDKETGEALLDAEGNEITSESEAFTATEKDMEIEMTFEAFVEELAGKTTVVFEDLLHNDVVVSYHHEIKDEEQSVHFPEIGTTAIADETEDHVIGANEEVTITDTVHYKNLLTDGREYTVKGTLYDKATGNPILIDGKEVTAEETFILEETEGDVEIVFTFEASALAGTTLVAFETVEYKGIEVAVHADLSDEEQTIYIPEIQTKAYDGKTRIDHSKAENRVTLYDQVTFTNLLPERDYVLKGYLVDKLSGEPILDKDGELITAEKEFWAEAESGVVIMEFTFDASLITPDPIVVFESLYYKDIEIAVHADIEDEEQSDYIPEIGTTAIAADTEDHLTNADEEVIIVDTVSYRGLKPNTKYEVTGILMDKESGEKILDAEDNEITSSVSFVTGDAEENEVRVDGEVEVTFTFDGSNLAGRTTVVFETLYRDGKEVAVHADINDDAQTIHFPDARTTATDQATETHSAHLDEEVVIEDLVKYTNLIPGKTYTVKGTLMVKETGEPLLDEDGDPITAEREFKAEKADGEILLSFTVDTTKLVGKSIVAFEDLQYEGITVVLHADLEDEDQTVVVPEIRTSAADKASGGKTMMLGDEIILVDTVSFTGLTPGEEYILKGKVMDKASGEVLKVDDKEVVSELRFIPETPDGAVCMEFILNTNDLKDKELVVFERLFDLKGNLIAVHEDINDSEQTVKVPTEPPKEPPKVIITGDENRPWPYFLLIGISAAALMALSMILVHGRKKKN